MDLSSFVVYLTVCFVLSCLIGIERQFRRRIIGIRTTILVSIGSFLFVCMSFLVPNEGVDITRIASQIVCGIGFLGAGAIVKDGFKIRGLTTAATLWCDAAIGVLCASGAIYEAMIGTFVILFSNIVLRRVNVWINNYVEENKHDEVYEIKITCRAKYVIPIKEKINDFIKMNRRFNIHIINFDFKTVNNISNIKFNLGLPKGAYDNFQGLMDDIYREFGPDNFQYEKIMDGQNEEEEEAL